jgi:ADP-ribose pyrophosphatase YjhB (NUDIX family)
MVFFSISMAKVIAGERIGKDGRLAIGCSAAVFDDSRQKILLIQRVDNGRWAVPGGYMEAGESLAEACAREVLEETGLRVRVGRLISVYTNPHLLLEYPDGNRLQLVVLHFEVKPMGGRLSQSSETSELNYFSHAETANLEVGPLDRLRIQDAFTTQEAIIVRNEF